MNEQKRDNNYYEGRLIHEHPAIYADLLNGKYRNVTEAANAAGLRKPRTRLHELKNAWKKASATERRDFLDWLKASAGSGNARALQSVFTGDNHLEPWARKRIEDIMKSRRITARSIRDEIGISAKDTSFESALRGARILKHSTRNGIEQWLLSQPSP